MIEYGIEKFSFVVIEETDDLIEREKFWINFYNSFENGYNLTMGGEGKRYIDYELVLSIYKEQKSLLLTSKILNIDRGTVSSIIHNKSKSKKNKSIKTKYGKSINMYDLQGNFLKEFPSISEASLFLIKNNHTNCKKGVICNYISDSCNNKRNTAFNFKWEFNNNSKPTV